MRKYLPLCLTLLLSLPPANASDISKDIEAGLGKMVAEELESSYGVVKDPLVTGWVDRVGQKLAKVSGRTNVKYQFKVLNSDDVNAVAAPGGFVYINRGTLRFVKSEDELATVMGHEVGHVAGKHSMKQLTAQLLGMAVLAGFQAVHAETLRTVGGVAGGLAMLKFGRDEENDADRRGVKNAVASGYDGSAMLDFFRRMQTIEKDKPSSFDVYHLHHPPTEERLKRIAKEPGTASSAGNLAALADGLADRSLYLRAADTYRKALDLNPDSTDLKMKLADALRRAPDKGPARKLSAAEKAEAQRQVAALNDELSEVRSRIAEDRKVIADTQKGTDDELDSAAKNLSQASQYINRKDSVQYREFVRMARAFDRAVRAGANLRSARDLTDETLEDMERLARSVGSAIDGGDAGAAQQVAALQAVAHSLLRDLAAGIKQARGRAGDARDGARTLSHAADSLYSSFRNPFGYSVGQFDLLGLQVSTAHDSLNDAVETSHKALGLISRANMALIVARINFATRAVRPDDTATAGIISHYLGVDPAEVKEMRTRLECGDAALSLA